ncbi:MAG: branched-chain amino acid ABC transporter permease [Chloroflexi bacterium]|nr:branched-chain amino acid ABC transporter permease [Chloroflexota bacterium]MBI3341331.1 branched-chain amino acid ABC transporter permease [Chloroflexota bacterium]
METTKKKNFNLRSLGVLVLVLYIVFLIGPIAGLDVPTIAASIKANPLQLIQFLIIGISNGAIIAIIALGYTMVYGIIELINFAHGDVYMIGVFTSLTVLSLTGTLNSTNPVQIVLGLAFALIIAIVVCASLNATIERLAYRRLRNAPRLAPLISAIGMSFIIENIGLMWAAQAWLVPSFGTTGGASQKVFPDMLSALFKATGFNGGDVNLLVASGLPLRLTVKDILVIVLAVALMTGLYLFVQRTQLGKAMRATAQNRDAAKMLGIDIDLVITATFLIGGGLAGAAGLMAGLYNNTAWWFMGFRAGLQAFTAAVLGGIGNITGAMLGGFLIGLLASFSDGYLNARWTNAWVFATLVLILLFRPTGLLGEQVGQKA